MECYKTIKIISYLVKMKCKKIVEKQQKLKLWHVGIEHKTWGLGDKSSTNSTMIPSCQTIAFNSIKGKTQ